MAQVLKIEGYSISVRDDVNNKDLFRSVRKDCFFTESEGLFTFFINGLETKAFNFNELIDDRTGSAFTSIDELITFLSSYLGSNTDASLIPVPLGLTGRVIVNSSNASAVLGGTIDSTKEYFLDGIIDLGTIQIEIPSGGISLRGYNFDVSGLISSQNSYTMFRSASGGAGDVLMNDLNISVTGTSSKVFDITDLDGTNAFEIVRVNFNNCTSLGDLYNYRQGLEDGTGRFGGSPSLTLHGNWSGGYSLTTSIVRNMSSTTTEPLFKAGTAFVMNSRFVTNINVDLGNSQPLLDFSTTNFPNSNTLQIKGAIITRAGSYESDQSTILPNIDETNLACRFKDNVGIRNTHVGGLMTLTTETVTNISSSNTFYPLAGTYTASDLQHFDSPVSGRLRNVSDEPIAIKIICYIVLDGGANDNITIRIRKFDSATSTSSTVISQQATINNFQGGNDRCTFSILGRTTLNPDDYIDFAEVANNSDSTNVEALIGTFSTIEERV